eukprot:TRINITY_DN589_c0_g1_i2.p2 TRINITY_DN589_c0_g1~~TRINITY_DN589_c0_g1_i2.p2  ORF type:complete len:258 (+),score=44.50 TRINITY_DN589_c0_g1_i2:129-902(+)
MASAPSTVPLVPVPTFSHQPTFSNSAASSSAGVPYSPVGAVSPGASSYGMPPTGFASSPTFSSYSGPALAVGAAGTPMGAQTIAERARVARPIPTPGPFAMPTSSFSAPVANLNSRFDIASAESLYSQYAPTDSKPFFVRAARVLQVDADARKLLAMSVVMMCLFVVELIFSTVVENLALFAAAFHSFYDGAAMAIALVTLVLSKERPTSSYSYGLERVEIVAAFSNGALLIFVGLYIGFEAIEHLFEPPDSWNRIG